MSGRLGDAVIRTPYSTLRDGRSTLPCHSGAFRIDDLKLRIVDFTLRYADLRQETGRRKGEID